jgi:Spy/CpxP family protein refolding chaperone
MRISLVCASVVALAAGSLVCTSSALAQPGRGPGFGGGSMFMLMNESIRKELEIVPEQEAKLRELGEKMRDEMREAFSGLRDLSREEREAKFAEMREKGRERMEAYQAQVDDILLDHQKTRLKQLRVQMQMRRGGVAGGLASEELANELGITEEQKKRLAEVREEVEKETQEKMRKIREEAREKILGVLTPQQRQKLEEMTGEEFEYQPQFGGRRGGGGPGGRGPGGRGGPGGGGGT